MKGDMFISTDGILGFPDDVEHRLLFSLEISAISVTKSDLSALPAMLDQISGLCCRRIQEELRRYIDNRLTEEEE